MANTISLYKLITGEFRNALFVNTIDMMNIISRQIEDVVINHKLPVDLYAGFQRYSHLKSQQQRYHQLSEIANTVTIFGIPDDPAVTATPGLEFVPLNPADDLAREWFLLVNTPYFYTALLTREVDHTPGEERRFEGIWTYDEAVVSQAYLLLHQYCGTAYTPTHQRDYHRHNQYITDIANSLATRLDLTSAADKYNRRFSQAVNGLAQTMAVDHTLTELMDATISNLLTNFQAHTVTAWQLDSGGQTMELINAAGLSGNWQQTADRRQPLDNQQLLAAAAIKTGEVQYIANIDKDHTDPIDPLARSAVAVPIQARGQVIGAVQVTNHRTYAYNPEMVNAFRSLGSYLGMALLSAAPASQSELESLLNTLDTPSDTVTWSILNCTPDAIIVLDADKTIQFINNAALTLLNLSENVSLTHQPVTRLNIPELTDLVNNLNPHNLPNQAEIALSPTQKVAVAGIAPTFAAGGQQLSHWTIALRDATAAAAVNLGQTAVQLKNRVQAMQDLLLLLPTLGSLSAPQTEALNRLKNMGAELTTLLSQLNGAAPAPAESPTPNSAAPTRAQQLAALAAAQPNLAPVNLPQLLEQVAGSFSAAAAAKEIKIQLEIPTNLPEFTGDEAMLSLALTELLDNTVKYSPSGGQVRVIAGITDHHLIIATRDNGKGIWLKDIPRLFEANYRVDNPQTQAVPGEGLGLTIVKTVAEKHRGRALVESRVGRGSVFLMKLPL